MTRALRELANALTALGNFVAAVAKNSDSANPGEIDSRKILEQALGQHERAATALRQLERLLMPEKPS